jgi:hypothetical protein
MVISPYISMQVSRYSIWILSLRCRSICAPASHDSQCHICRCSLVVGPLKLVGEHTDFMHATIGLLQITPVPPHLHAWCGSTARTWPEARSIDTIPLLPQAERTPPSMVRVRGHAPYRRFINQCSRAPTSSGLHAITPTNYQATVPICIDPSFRRRVLCHVAEEFLLPAEAQNVHTSISGARQS